jgi:hypothetical protein
MLSEGVLENTHGSIPFAKSKTKDKLAVASSKVLRIKSKTKYLRTLEDYMWQLFQPSNLFYSRKLTKTV